MFFCDPPGRSDADSLFNHGHNTTEHNYIFFHDQEPIHLDIHRSLFDAVQRRNIDLRNGKGPVSPVLITSEYQSEPVDQVCSQYSWASFYYFFHGWAALDWYRGYDKTFLMPPPELRRITHSFINPNRIVGGHRSHRLELMYLLQRASVKNALISFPAVCPYEQHAVLDLAQTLRPKYPDAVEVFESLNLPLNFHNEQDHPMHSCWLSLFEENATSLAHVITETVFQERRVHLTEKTFKPICLRMPFVMVSSAHSLEYLRRYGFRTFADYWDESYDQEEDSTARLHKISCLLLEFDTMRQSQLQQLFQSTLPVLEHNYQHFYGGGFASILWQEMQALFRDLKSHHEHVKSLL